MAAERQSSKRLGAVAALQQEPLAAGGLGQLRLERSRLPNWSPAAAIATARTASAPAPRGPGTQRAARWASVARSWATSHSAWWGLPGPETSGKCGPRRIRQLKCRCSDIGLFHDGHDPEDDSCQSNSRTQCPAVSSVSTVSRNAIAARILRARVPRKSRSSVRHYFLDRVVQMPSAKDDEVSPGIPLRKVWSVV